MSELWLVRHGETEWSLSGQHTGRTNIPLTPHGEAQARDAGQRLRHRKFVQVLESPLLRARETCRLAGYGDVATPDPDLQEWDYGGYEGKTSAEIQKEVPGWNIWTHGVKGGESVEQVGQRVDRVIARAVAAGGDVLLFAHGHVLRVLAARWLGLEPEGGRLLVLDPAAICRLGHEHDTRVIHHWNLTGV